MNKSTGMNSNPLPTDEEKRKLFAFLGDPPENKENEELTFTDVLNKYLPEIAKRWKSWENTLIPYSNDYAKTIIPAIKKVMKKLQEEHPEVYNAEDMPLPLSKCSSETFYSVIDEIRKSSNIIYSKERMDHFLYLCERVVEVASNHNICPNFLYGTRPGRESPKKKDDEGKTLLPKSLSPLMNAIIFYALTVCPERMPGEWAGLLLMFSFGLRNTESVSVCYEDLDDIRSGINILLIYSSAEASRSTKKKTGSKTKNAFRGIVIVGEIIKALNRRRNSIEDKVQEEHPEWTPEKVKKTVDTYPIACKGKDYSTAISPAQLTDAGRDFFSRIKCDDFNEDDFYLANCASFDKDYMESSGFDYKDPTAYLFRREFGSTLKILGFTKEEREFLMGHLIEEGEFSLNDFLNSPRIYVLEKKMKQRPLFNTISRTITDVCSRRTPYGAPSVPNEVYHIANNPDGSSQILINISANEPGDTFRTKTKAKTSMRNAHFLNPNNHEQPNILVPYQKVMLEAAKRFSDPENGKENLKKIFRFPFSLD